MKAVAPERRNVEGLTCPNCGTLLKTSLMEDDMFVCPNCIERFEGAELRGGVSYADFYDDEGELELSPETIDEWVEGDEQADDTIAIESVAEDEDDEPAIPAAADKPKKEKKPKEKKAHPGLAFFIGFLIGALLACAVVAALNIYGVSVPYLSGAEASKPVPEGLANILPAANNTNAIEEGSNENTEATDDEDTPAAVTASMRELLKGMGYFDDVKVQGKGGNTVDLPVKGAPCLLHVVYNGPGNIKITAVNKNGKGNVLLDAAAPYEGTITTYFESTPAEAVEIVADGEWIVKFIPMGNMLHATNGSISLVGDDTVFIDEEDISSVHFTHKGEGTFKVRAGVVDGSTIETVDVVDANGAYDSDIAWSEGKAFFIVSSQGEWTMSWK